jgi:hypothetical protein
MSDGARELNVGRCRKNIEIRFVNVAADRPVVAEREFEIEAVPSVDPIACGRLEEKEKSILKIHEIVGGYSRLRRVRVAQVAPHLLRVGEASEGPHRQEFLAEQWRVEPNLEFRSIAVRREQGLANIQTITRCGYERHGLDALGKRTGNG